MTGQTGTGGSATIILRRAYVLQISARPAFRFPQCFVGRPSRGAFVAAYGRPGKIRPGLTQPGGAWTSVGRLVESLRFGDRNPGLRRDVDDHAVLVFGLRLHCIDCEIA